MTNPSTTEVSVPAVAVLDDYQDVALTCTDWSIDGRAVDVNAFHHKFTTEDELVGALAPYEIVVAMRERTAFPASVLSRLPNLRLLVSLGKRNVKIDLDAARSNGVVVCGTEAMPRSTAEHSWALLMALARNIPTEAQSISTGGWQTTLGDTLHGRVMGILGLGQIGAMVARYALAFDMDVIAWSENLTDARAHDAGATRVSREEFFARSEFLSVHMRLSERTVGLVGDVELQAMPPESYFVSTSRAEIVSVDAICRALSDGPLRGAALDNFRTEPLPRDDPLRSVQGLLVTPHLGYVTRSNYQLFFDGAIEAIHGFLRGQPVRVLT